MKAERDDIIQKDCLKIVGKSKKLDSEDCLKIVGNIFRKYPKKKILKLFTTLSILPIRLYIQERDATARKV